MGEDSYRELGSFRVPVLNFAFWSCDTDHRFRTVYLRRIRTDMRVTDHRPKDERFNATRNSRKAVGECSPRRQEWVYARLRTKPRRGERICRIRPETSCCI
jgi:hypothetical protein